MRCSDVTRALAAPGGGHDPTELDRHLAACPRCAGWVGRAEQFDRLWAATRPAEPAAEVFDALWARVARDASRAEPAAPRRRVVTVVGWSVAGLAAAAALLVAVWTPRGGPGRPDEVASVEPPAAIAPEEPELLAQTFEVEPGQMPIIRIDGQRGRLESLAGSTTELVADAGMVSAPVSNDFDMLNRAGSLGAGGSHRALGATVPALMAATFIEPGAFPTDALARPEDLPDAPTWAGVPSEHQVMLLAVAATPGRPAVDRSLEDAGLVLPLRDLVPDHPRAGLRLLGKGSWNLTPRDSLALDLGDDLTATVELVSVVDFGGKVRLRVTLARGDQQLFDAIVATPLHQPFFCDAPRPEGGRLLLMAGAR